MKRAVILFLFALTLTNCEDIAEDLLYGVADAIAAAVEGDKPAYDTFLRVENNSNFTMEGFEIGFEENDTVLLNSLLPNKIYASSGFYQISDAPYIRFMVNEVEYIREIKDPTNYVYTGSFVMKIKIISIHNQTFSFIIQQE